MNGCYGHGNSAFGTRSPSHRACIRTFTETEENETNFAHKLNTARARHSILIRANYLQKAYKDECFRLQRFCRCKDKPPPRGTSREPIPSSPRQIFGDGGTRPGIYSTCQYRVPFLKKTAEYARPRNQSSHHHHHHRDGDFAARCPAFPQVKVKNQQRTSARNLYRTATFNPQNGHQACQRAQLFIFQVIGNFGGASV